MFFQSKKKSFWKRLWRLRVSTTNSSSNNTNHNVDDMEQDHHMQQQSLVSHRRNIDIGRGEGSHLMIQNLTASTASGEAAQMSAAATRTTSSSTSFIRNCCTSSQTTNSNTDLTEQDQFRLFRALVDKLRERQLETLCQSIESIQYNSQQQMLQQQQQHQQYQQQQQQQQSQQHYHRNHHLHQYQSVPQQQQQLFQQPQQQIVTDCVLVPRTTIGGEDPQLIACRIWRWTDINHSGELKRIPSCPNEKDPVYICCNPAHWSRQCKTDTPPPPYCQMDRLIDHDLSANEKIYLDDEDDDGGNYRLYSPPGSLTTGDDSSTSTGWCQIAYWELTQRVGRLFHVENPHVNVFSEQSRVDGLCLTTLAQQRKTSTPEAVLKARQKIGLGVTLSLESDGVWLYNRSSAPVFVHSSTLNDMDSRSLLVYRVPPGHCLLAFDPKRAKTRAITWPSVIAGQQTGPVDIHSVRISFAKGWGPKYTRQEVTACPCWLEVLLSPCR